MGGASACPVEASAKTDPREPGLMQFAAKIGSPAVSPHQSWIKLTHYLKVRFRE
jgi:hypothetical protein